MRSGKSFSSQSAGGGAPLHASKPQTACFLPNGRTITKLAIFKNIYISPPSQRAKKGRKRRERTVSFGVCVALEGESDGSPSESSLGFPGSHRGK